MSTIVVLPLKWEVPEPANWNGSRRRHVAVIDDSIGNVAVGLGKSRGGPSGGTVRRAHKRPLLHCFPKIAPAVIGKYHIRPGGTLQLR